MRRYLAVSLVAAVVALLFVAEAEGWLVEEEGPSAFSTGPALDMPRADMAEAASSTWYCAAGSALPEGTMNLSVVVVNSGEEVRNGTVTWMTSEAAPVEVKVRVAGLTSVEVVATEALNAPVVSAVVELDGGGVVVEHVVTGPSGAGQAPCASFSSDRWYLANGVTARDASQLLVLFNPFPDDAIVDVSLSTEPGGRDEPGDLRGLPVEAGTTSVVDVGQFVRLRDRTSISVVARSGRLVVDRVQSFDGSEGGRLGLSLMLASPGLAESWAFPAGEYSASTTEQWHVYNPSGEEAVVDLHLVPDEGQSLEPVSLTVPPLGRVTVDAAAIARVPADVGHSSTVRSVNRVAVVVERELDARPPSEQPGWTSSLGAPQAASRWVQTNGAGRADELVGQTTVIYNPGATAVMVAVANLDSATQASPRRVELDPAERVVLDATRSLLIEADGLVIVERVLARSSGPATSIAIPV